MSFTVLSWCINFSHDSMVFFFWSEVVALVFLVLWAVWMRVESWLPKIAKRKFDGVVDWVDS